MPANLPSPVVGAGGQGSRPWYEQLLLTLASQGPGTLMQWLEHRQVSQQAAANDQAAQGALANFSTGANPSEAGAITQMGGQMGQQGVQPAGSAASPSGIQMPSVAPMTSGNQPVAPNMQGMKRGVAGPLLAQLQQQRNFASTQRASDAATTLSVNQDTREGELQTGRVALQGEQIATSQQQRKQSAAEIRLATQRAANEKKRFPIELQLLESEITRNDLMGKQAVKEGNALAANLAAEHRKEYSNLAGVVGPEAASRIVYDGSPQPPSMKQLTEMYSGALSSGNMPDLYTVIKEGMLKEFGMTPEQYTIIADRAAAAQDPNEVLRDLMRQGTPEAELRNIAAILKYDLGYNVNMPVPKVTSAPEPAAAKSAKNPDRRYR